MSKKYGRRARLSAVKILNSGEKINAVHGLEGLLMEKESHHMVGRQIILIPMVEIVYQICIHYNGKTI